MQNVKCIDFDYSSIGWKTKKDSLGIFRIDTAPKEEKNNNLNYLAKTVMAGNVYSPSVLPIVPNYNFQVETGPVLLKKNKKFISAFVFFNSINKCQIVPYYPKLGGKIEELKVKIKFFINA